MKGIYIYLFILILIIVTLFFLYSINNKDYYQINDNLYKMFKKKLNSVNRKVRKNCFTYYKCAGEINEWIIFLIKNKLKNSAIKFYIVDDLNRGHPDLEFNYSHTMGKKIILSDNDYNYLLNDYENDNINTKIDELIIHESAHVHQRVEEEKERKYLLEKNLPYKNPFKELYKKWGFIYINNEIMNFSDIIKYKRQNPDANDDNIIWLNNGKYYYINYFYDRNNVSPYVVNKYAYPLKLKGSQYVYEGETPILLNKLYNYIIFFGDFISNYTPNEIYATYCEMLYKENVYNTQYNEKKAYKIFKNNYFYK